MIGTNQAHTLQSFIPIISFYVIQYSNKRMKALCVTIYQRSLETLASNLLFKYSVASVLTFASQVVVGIGFDRLMMAFKKDNINNILQPGMGITKR